MNSLRELFIDQLKDIYNAENQLTKALPKLAKKASSPMLKNAFESHLKETENHVTRLNNISEMLGIKLSGKKCPAMTGLVEEGREILNEKGQDAVIDVGLVCAAQRVEHYEMAAYGNARTLAEKLGQPKIAAVLQETLDEEGAANEKLTFISENNIFPSAPTNTDEGWARPS